MRLNYNGGTSVKIDQCGNPSDELIEGNHVYIYTGNGYMQT